MPITFQTKYLWKVKTNYANCFLKDKPMQIIAVPYITLSMNAEYGQCRGPAMNDRDYTKMY